MTQTLEQLEHVKRPDQAGPTAHELRHGIIHTQVSRRVAWMMVVGFAAITCAVPMMQGMRLPRVSGWVPTRGELKHFEDSVRDGSRAAEFVQPRLQALLCQWGGSGSSGVVVGRDGWLFFRPGIDSLTGGAFLDSQVMMRRTRNWKDAAAVEQLHPDPRPAILQFKAQVEAAGARLLLLPVADKATLQSDQLTRRSIAAPVHNPSFHALLEEIGRAGVEVFDPAPAKLTPGESRYLIQDTHWTPRWMEEVARALARRIDPNAKPTADLRRQNVTLSNSGDLVEMLRLGERQELFRPQGVETRRVVTASGKPLRPDTSSPILLLGDSFSNIYSAGQMGWGDSAGLPEQLSFYLGQTIDWMARNDAGAHATREMLATKIAQGENRLAGKKVVIWQIAERELALGNWKLIDMVASPAGEPMFVVPPIRQEWTITGTVAAKGISPRPQRVAYRDHILAVHLTGVSVEGESRRGEALVYLRSMTDLKLTPAASLQVGQQVRVKVVDWSTVSRRYQLINRSEVPDPTLRRQPACWGELLTN